MPYNRDKIFKNIGKGIKKFNQLETDKQDIDTVFSEWIVLLNDSIDEREFLQLVADNIKDDEDNIEGMKISTVSLLKTYMLTGVREDLFVADRNIDIVLDRLIDAMISAIGSYDLVLENDVYYFGNQYGDAKGQLDNWNMDGVSIGSNTDLVGRCTVLLQAAGAGHQVSAYSDPWATEDLVAQGSIADDGEVTLAEQGGSGLSGTVDLLWLNFTSEFIYVFLCPEPDIENTGTGRIEEVILSQQVHTNHKIVIECTDATTPGSELWSVKINKKDETKLINLGTATTGVEFENEKYGIKFTITRATAILEQYDDANQLSNWSLSGVTRAFCHDYGILYAELSDVAGTRTVTLYKSIAFGSSEEVAQGSRSGDGVITLTERNSSGISGNVTVAYTGDDSKIIILPVLEFAVGDKFYFNTFHDGAGLFQTFFVEEWDTALPSTSSGENIPNSWAE